MLGIGGLKSLFGGSVNKISGRKDVLEGICAAGALVAAADGNISDEEIAATQKTVASNRTISAAFATGDINKTLEVMLKRAEGGRVGQMELYKEIEEVAKNNDEDTRIIILAGALDVADQNGIDDKEKVVLEKIAGKLGLKLSDYI